MRCHRPGVVLLLLSMLAVGAHAEDAAPPLPDRNPERTKGPEAHAAPAKPLLPGEQPTVPWTDAEITAAKADCTKVLGSLKLDYEPLPPIKLGLCGAPAPIRVKSIGDNPKVIIDPPATMRCSLAAALGKWLDEIVQPEAKADLNSQVVKLRNASDYVCRNRYGAAVGTISEHAFANALDVSEFDFASGVHITVLDSWPKLLAKTPPAAAVPPANSLAPVAAASTETPRPNPSEVRDAAAASDAPPLPVPNPRVERVANAAPPPAKPADMPPPAPDPQGTFLRHVHDIGCKDFGTVLGPEANAAHKTHFHLDMKSRHSSYCQ